MAQKCLHLLTNSDFKMAHVQTTKHVGLIKTILKV